MASQAQHDCGDVSGIGFTSTPAKEEMNFSKATRYLSILVFGLSICLLVALLFVFGTALHLNHESMIFDTYNYLIWTGSLILALLVALFIFRL